MRCEEVRSLLDAYLDGELDPVQCSCVEAHIGGCGACREHLGAMRELHALTRELPREIAPARDLWPGVAAAITGVPRKRTAVARFAGMAAAAALLGGFLVAAYLLGAHTAGVGDQARAAQRPGELAVAVREYARASQSLRESLGQRQGSFTPATAGVVTENLAIIDQAISRIQRELAADPGNRDLALLLVATYQQEIDLLQRAMHMPAQS